MRGNMQLPEPEPSVLRWCVVENRWGWCGLQRGEGGMRVCTLPLRDRRAAALAVADASPEALDDPLLHRAADLLSAYFEGHRVHFDLAVEPMAIGPFGSRVLAECARIPWGETRSYGQLAALAGSPRAARAVGQALGRNPLPVIVPCHRVIGSTGQLVGFGSGIEMKRRLLQLEGIIAPV
ncbi:MAG TPA: hypothetical protein DEP45_05745 [Armatimonadetes bacterium]|nr:hypothetical protein [Armatimonadota bacterium]